MATIEHGPVFSMNREVITTDEEKEKWMRDLDDYLKTQFGPRIYRTAYNASDKWAKLEADRGGPPLFMGYFQLDSVAERHRGEATGRVPHTGARARHRAVDDPPRFLP